jgi:uncharacterized membrane protein YhhN
MNPLIFLYAALILLNLYAALTHSFALNLATKPLLMLVLALYFYQNIAKNLDTGSKKWLYPILIGLICSISGDTWLIWDDNTSFMLGLGSFLLAHLSYFVGFYQYPSENKGLLHQKPIFALPMLVFWFCINYFLWQNLADLKIPVIVYSGVITLMTLGAIHLSGKIGSLANLLLCGVALFVLSDTMIAINKFYTPIPYSALWIMTTYLLGQYCIAKGVLKIHAT